MCARAGQFSGWANNPYHAAGGRRRYNQQRQMKALERQYEVAQLMSRYGLGYGSGVKIARELGVSESTISRDVRAIFTISNGARCPCCGGMTRRR